MTYTAFETSVEDGTPVEIFEFTLGTTSYFLTSAEDNLLVVSQIYTAVAGLSRDTTADGPAKREHDFQIDIPTSHPLAQTFVGQMPGVRIRVQVRRFHREDLPTPEVVIVFDGFIQSASFSKDLTITSLNAKTELAGVGLVLPRRKFMSSCNHVLYDPLTCQVVDTDVAFRASSLFVLSQIDSTLTVTGGLSGVYADGFMIGGYVEAIALSDFRLILGHIGNALLLHQPFVTKPATVNVLAGCDHSIAICSSKFNKVNRFGGFAFVPGRDIHMDGII